LNWNWSLAVGRTPSPIRWSNYPPPDCSCAPASSPQRSDSRNPCTASTAAPAAPVADGGGDADGGDAAGADDDGGVAAAAAAAATGASKYPRSKPE